MGYLLLAVMFYTVVKYSTRVWTQIRYEAQEDKRETAYRQQEKEIIELKEKVQRS